MSDSKAEITAGYVVTDDGEILVQIPDQTSRWGFYLADEGESWDGGFGVAGAWTLMAEDDPRITPEVRERLGWVIEQGRDNWLLEEQRREIES